MDKQLTNEIIRTRKKLELLNSSGIGQFIKDFCDLFENETTYGEITLKLKKLENKYLTILDKSDQLENQIKLDL